MQRPGWKFNQNQKSHTQDGPNLVRLMKPVGKGLRKVLAIDVGCGDGIIAKEILDYNKATQVVAIDIQSEAIKAATHNLKEEIFLEKAKVVKTTAQKFFKKKENLERFDCFVINPPFFAQGSGEANKNKKDQIARHEVQLKMKMWVKGAARLLKFGGDLYCVFPTERLSELLVELSKNKIEPKELCWYKSDKRMRRFFLRAKRGAKPGLQIAFK
ncbi:MAG: methyltransferase [Oligoflexia bacterium]|nr:methyltransferase [Oligoflexia bacterium]